MGDKKIAERSHAPRLRLAEKKMFAEAKNAGHHGAADAGLIGSVGTGALTSAPLPSGVVGWSSQFYGAFGALGTGLTGANSTAAYGVVGFNDVSLVTGASATGAGVIGIAAADGE